MIDVFIGMAQVIIDCLILIFNMEIPFYGNVKITVGTLVVSVLTFGTIIHFVLEFTGINKRRGE